MRLYNKLKKDIYIFKISMKKNNTMSKIAIDANIPISFINEKVEIWTIFENYVESTGHEILMPEEVFDEVKDRKTRMIFRNSDFINKITLEDDVFDQIQTDCLQSSKTRIQKNDYKLIGTAVYHNADYIVSNDYALIKVVESYKQMKSIPKHEILPLRAAGLLRLMHEERKNLFGWKSHISKNLKFYHHIEIPHTCEGIKSREWDERYAKARFKPFHENIINTITSVGK